MGGDSGGNADIGKTHVLLWLCSLRAHSTTAFVLCRRITYISRRQQARQHKILVNQQPSYHKTTNDTPYAHITIRSISAYRRHAVKLGMKSDAVSFRLVPVFYLVFGGFIIYNFIILYNFIKMYSRYSISVLHAIGFPSERERVFVGRVWVQSGDTTHSKPVCLCRPVLHFPSILSNNNTDTKRAARRVHPISHSLFLSLTFSLSLTFLPPSFYHRPSGIFIAV